MRERLTKLLGYLETDSKNFLLLGDAADLALQCGEWEIAADLVERSLEQRLATCIYICSPTRIPI